MKSLSLLVKPAISFENDKNDDEDKNSTLMDLMTVPASGSLLVICHTLYDNSYLFRCAVSAL